MTERSTFFNQLISYIIHLMIQTDLRNPFGSAPVFYKERTGSTMKDIRNLKEYGHGTVIFAGFQNTGRGRIPGRKWASDKGRNLLMTLQLTPDRLFHPFYQVPLLTGLGIASFLEKQFGLAGLIKWPNDVLVKGRKISGILCESRGAYIAVGIGLNCQQTDFDESIQGKTTSIALLSDQHCDPESILPLLLEELKSSYRDPLWREKITSRLYFLDQTVTLLEGAAGEDKRSEVRILGLSEEGFLSVQVLESGEMKNIMAGEIHFPGYN